MLFKFAHMEQKKTLTDVCNKLYMYSFCGVYKNVRPAFLYIEHLFNIGDKQKNLLKAFFL